MYGQPSRTSLARWAALTAASVLVLASCQAGSPSAGSPSASSSGAASPQGLQKITVRMGYSWAADNYYALYLDIRDFFTKEGLDPTIVEGTGSGNTVQLIANGQADFGAAVTSGAIIRAVSKGAKIKAVAQTIPFNEITIFSSASAPLKTPKDLVGKRIAVDPGGDRP